MAAVMIGVDPHKSSHTAVVIGPAEEPLGELRVRASAAQAEKLIGWAAAWPERTWAVEGAAGLGAAAPVQAVAWPLISKDALLGIIETAAFRAVDAREKALLEELG